MGAHKKMGQLTGHFVVMGDTLNTRVLACGHKTVKLMGSPTLKNYKLWRLYCVASRYRPQMVSSELFVYDREIPTWRPRYSAQVVDLLAVAFFANLLASAFNNSSSNDRKPKT